MRSLSPLMVVSACLLLLPVCSCRRSADMSAVATSGIDGDSSLERVIVGTPIRKTLVLTTTQPARIEAFEETPLYAKLAGFV